MSITFKAIQTGTASFSVSVSEADDVSTYASLSAKGGSTTVKINEVAPPPPPPETPATPPTTPATPAANTTPPASTNTKPSTSNTTKPSTAPKPTNTNKPVENNPNEGLTDLPENYIAETVNEAAGDTSNEIADEVAEPAQSAAVEENSIKKAQLDRSKFLYLILGITLTLIIEMIVFITWKLIELRKNK